MRLFFICLLVLPSLAAASAQHLTIGGTGAALGGMRLLSEAFSAQYPDAEIQVLPSLGSKGGIMALLDDKIDLAVFSRRLKAEELAGGVEEVLYANTPLVLVGQADVASGSLSIDDVMDIFAGRMKAWQDGTPLRLVIRPPHETDFKLLRRKSSDMDQAIASAYERPGLLMAENDQENCSMIETLPGAFGLASLAQILSEERNIKVLLPASDQPSAADSLTMSKSFYLGVKKQSPPLALAFVDFVLSDAGRKLLEDHGHEPVSDVTARP